MPPVMRSGDRSCERNSFASPFAIHARRPFGPPMSPIAWSPWRMLFERIKAQGLDYWADPARRRPQEINRNDGGRGVYFPDPDGHFFEVITRPYGSGS